MANILPKKNASCVVNVSRKGLALCGASIGGVLEMPFTSGVVSDLDVISLTELSGQVKSFVETNRVGIGELILVLGSDTYFEKDLTGDDAENAQAVQDFVDSVPLTNPSSKIFKVGEKYKVVVIDRRLYESLRTAFEAVGFGVKAVVPELVLGSVGVVGSEFNLNSCRLILKGRDFILANSFIGPAAAVEEDNWINNHKKQAVILAVAAIAVSVMGVGFIVWQTISSRNAAIAKAAARAARVAQVQVTPTPQPTATPISASASTSLADYTIQVEGDVTAVKDALKKAGFTNITVGNSGQVSKSMVVFAVRVPQDVRTKLVGTLTSILGEVAVVENSQAQFDALITVGKITP